MAATRLLRTTAVGAFVTLSVSGCFTGERPTFENQDTIVVDEGSTGSVDIDAVLERLERVGLASFTADYTIETRFGALTSRATVVQGEGDRSAVVVERDAGTTRFAESSDSETTCDVITGECESSLNDARISDVGIPHTFYGPSFARRLRVSADRRIADSSAYTKTIAGQDARCVDVTVSGGTETFCALDSGVLAEFVGADVTVTLDEYSPVADEALL